MVWVRRDVMENGSKIYLIDIGTWVGFIIVINLFSESLPRDVALGIATFLFSLTRSIIGLEYRGFEAVITPRGEREGLAHAVIRSAVIGIIVIIVSHYLSRLQLI